MTTMMPSSSSTSDILRPIPRRAFELSSNNGPSSPSPASIPSTPRQDSSATPDTMETSRVEAGGVEDNNTPPSRTRSILNLTSSTLFGIYSPSTTTIPSERGDTTTTASFLPSSPAPPPILRMDSTNDESFLGLPATEPKRPNSSSHHHHAQTSLFQRMTSWTLRTGLLFLFGIAYGMMILHLHDHHQFLAPVEVIGVHGVHVHMVHSWKWSYPLFWGLAGVVLGRGLPWVDTLWEEYTHANRSRSPGLSNYKMGLNEVKEVEQNETGMPSARIEGGSGNGTTIADWSLVVRSIGAFVGIAFAIRKLPWQSTLQLSLTLTLVNPVLWYLIDRSKQGLILSSLIGILGTGIVLGINPGIVPAPNSSPAPTSGPITIIPTITSSVLSSSVSGVISSASASASVSGVMSNSSWAQTASSGTWPWMTKILPSSESIAVGTWIASVLFCSCVCFGNIGRRLVFRGSGNTSSSQRNGRE